MRVLYGSYIFLFILVCCLAHGQGKDSLSPILFLPEDSLKVRVKRLAINSDRSDFSPALVNGSLVFASGRMSKMGVTYSDEHNTDVTDLFYAPLRDSVRFGKVRPFDGTVNSKYNEGPFTFSEDGATVYFSGNAGNQEPGKTARRLQIYTSKKSGTSWSAPEAASFCNPDFSNCHPAFSKSNTTIVFCSDMPGGFGGTDLYYTQLKNNTWTLPVNFGPGVNTASNEVFPFMASDSVLYFSSSRQGPGGLDIYAFDFADSLQKTATLLEAPFNTSFDDFGIWLNADKRSGYLSSNRQPVFKDDIYYFSSIHPDFSKAVTPPVKTKFCYTFFEENAYQSNDSVSMTYEWDFGGGNKIRSEKCKYCFSKPGDYEVRLNVVEKNSGETFYNQVTYTLTVEAPPQLQINCPDSVSAGDELQLDAAKCALKGYQLQNFYWSFGDERYNSGMYTRHRYAKKGNYTIELGVTAKNEATQKTDRFKVIKTIVIKDHN